MNSKKNLRMFPWISSINPLVRKSCFSRNSSLHEELFQHLYCEASREISSILEDNDFKRAEKLCDVLSHYIFSFHTSNITLQEELKVPKKSFIMLLSCLVDLHIFLCRGDSSSYHLENCIRDMSLFTGSHLYSLWDILLGCNLFMKTHSTILIPILNHVMKKLPEVIGDPEDYMKMIVLMRFWRKFYSSMIDKDEVLFTAYQVRPPADFLYWFSVMPIENMPEIPELEGEMLVRHFLCRQFPKGFFKKVKMLLSKGTATPDSAFFVDRGEESAFEENDAKDLLIDISGLKNFEDDHFADAELSEADNVKKLKKNTAEGFCNASAGIPSELNSVEGPLGEPEIPNLRTKRKKKSKKKRKQPESEDFLSNSPPENSNVEEEPDIVMADYAETAAHSKSSKLKSQGLVCGGKTMKTSKSGSQKSKKNKESLENQFEGETTEKYSNNEAFVEVHCSENIDASFVTEGSKVNKHKLRITAECSGSQLLSLHGKDKKHKPKKKSTDTVSEANIVEIAQKEKLDECGINKDVAFDHSDAGMPDDTVKKLKKKRKRKSSSVELNSLEDGNKVSEVVALGSIVLADGVDRSSTNPCKRIKKAKDHNVLEELRDSSHNAASLVPVAQKMKDTEVTSELGNHACGSVHVDDFNHEVLHLVSSKKNKRKKKKKGHSTHVCSEESNPLLNLQTEETADAPYVVEEGDEMKEDKLEVSADDKSKKHKPRKKKNIDIISGGSSEKITPMEKLDECSIKDMGLDNSDAGLLAEAVKKPKKKHKKKSVAEEWNSLEDRNQLNEDVVLGSIMLDAVDSSGTTPCKLTKKAKMLAKDLNVFVELEDASPDAASLVPAAHKMKDAEVASELGNHASDSVHIEDGLNLEVSHPVPSKKKNKKKHHSSHMYAEELDLPQNLQTEQNVDLPFVMEGNKAEDKLEVSAECNSSRLFSPHDKDKKRKAKKKNADAISEASDVIEVAPKEELDECSINKDVGFDNSDAGVLAEAVKRQKKKHKRKSIADELNSFEDSNKVSEDVALGSIVLDAVDSSSTTPCKLTKKAKMLAKDLNAFVELEDASPDAASLVPAAHKMKETEVTLELGNHASNSVHTEDLNLEVSHLICSKKKDHSFHMYAEELNLPQNCQTEQNVDASFVVDGNEPEDKLGVSAECSSSQLFSPHGKDKMHNPKKKKDVDTVSEASDVIEVAPKEELDECSINKDMSFDNSDAGMLAEAVKKRKKKHKRKSIVDELNSLEDTNKVNEDVALESIMLADGPDSSSNTPCKHIKSKLSKDLNVSVELGASLVSAGHKMQETEVASKEGNPASDSANIEDDLNLEVSCLANSKKKKKKDCSSHMFAEEFNPPLNLQTEKNADASFVVEGGKMEDKLGVSAECNNSQLLSPHDIFKKHKPKRKKNTEDSSVAEVTPKKQMDDCGFQVSNLDGNDPDQKSKSPMNGSNSLLNMQTQENVDTSVTEGKEMEEGTPEDSPEYNSSLFGSPSGKEKKHKLSKKHTSVNEGSGVAKFDDSETREKSESPQSSDVADGLQSIKLEVSPSVLVSAKKGKSNTAISKEDPEVPRSSSLIQDSPEEKRVLPSKEQTWESSFESSPDPLHTDSLVSSSFTENSIETRRKKWKSKVAESVHDEFDICGKVVDKEHRSFLSTESSADASHSESMSNRRKKSVSKSFEITGNKESIEKNENNSFFGSAGASLSNIQSVESESHLSCNAETLDAGLTMPDVVTECMEGKKDSSFDASESLNTVPVHNEELPTMGNKTSSEGPEVLTANEDESLDASKHYLSPKNLARKEREKSALHSDESSAGIKMSNDVNIDATHRENPPPAQVTGRFEQGEESEEERTVHSDPHTYINSQPVSSAMDSICDATESSDASDDDFNERTFINLCGTRKNELKTKIISESESSDSLFEEEKDEKMTNFPLTSASPDKNSQSCETELVDSCAKSGHNKKKDSDSAATPLKSLGESVPTNADNSSGSQKTPSKAEILRDAKPSEAEMLFGDLSSDSEFSTPLYSRVRKRLENSDDRRGISNKSANEKFQDVKDSPAKDLKLFLESSSEDESCGLSNQTTKISEQPKTPVSSDPLQSQHSGDIKSCEGVEEEKSGSGVSDLSKDSIADISDRDLLASLENESLVPILHPVNVKNIQSHCDSSASLTTAEVTGDQETVRVESNCNTENKISSCDVIKISRKIASDSTNKDKSFEMPRIERSPLKDVQKIGITGECASKIKVRCSPDELISERQTPQSDKISLQTSLRDDSQDKLTLPHSVSLNSLGSSSNTCADKGLISDFTERAMSPELTSQPDVRSLSDDNSHRTSSSVDSSDDSSSGDDSKDIVKCGSARQSTNILEMPENSLPLHGSLTKGKLDQAACNNNNNALSPSGTVLSPTDIPQQKVDSNLACDKTYASSPEKSPTSCEQSSSTPCSKHINESPTFPVLPHTSSKCLSTDESDNDSAAKKKENIAFKASSGNKRCDAPVLRHSSRVKHGRLSRSLNKELSGGDRKHSAPKTSPQPKRISVSTPLRHSSRIRQKKITYFPGEKLLTTKRKKSPSRVCLSESSSMMDVRNHLDFSDLKTSPQSGPVSNKNPSPSLKMEESDTDTAKDQGSSDNMKSFKISPDVKVDLPPPSLKSRLRTPTKAEGESPASSSSSTNGEPESPVRKSTAKSKGLFPAEPKQYSRKSRDNSSDHGTSVIDQSLKQLCLTTACSSVVQRLSVKSARTPDQTSLADSVVEGSTECPGRTETASETDDNEAVPSRIKSPSKIRDIKKNPFADIVSSSCSKMKTRRGIFGTTEKSREELITKSCSKVRARKSLLPAASEKDMEGYNLRSRKSLIVPPKLNV